MPVPTDPTNFAVSASTASTVSLSWTPGTGQTSWVLKQYDGAHNHLFQTLTIDLAIEPDVTTAAFGLTPNTSAIFSLQAFNGSGNSNIVEVNGNTIAPLLPSQIIGTLITLDPNGSPLANVPVNFQMTAGPGTSGYSPSSKQFTETSDGSGNLSVTLEQGATYQAWRSVGNAVDVVVPTSGTSFTLPEILGGAS